MLRDPCVYRMQRPNEEYWSSRCCWAPEYVGSFQDGCGLIVVGWGHGSGKHSSTLWEFSSDGGQGRVGWCCPSFPSALATSPNLSGPLSLTAIWGGILCSPRLPGKAIYLEGRRSTTRSWESEGVTSPPVRGGGDGKGWMTRLWLLWETQEVLAEVLAGGKTWLDVASGKRVAGGGDCSGEKQGRAFFSLGIFNSFEPRT